MKKDEDVGASLLTAGLEVISCSGCGGVIEVVTATEWWTAWGSSAFDFNWQKHSGELSLCEKCENEEWVVCDECGARIDRDLYGGGYPDDFDGEHICPECAIKKGVAISVNICTSIVEVRGRPLLGDPASPPG